MAKVEDLINRVGDSALRQALAAEVYDLKRRVPWGLVFERHLPEITKLLAAPIRTGSYIWERRSRNPKRMRVIGVTNESVVAVPAPPNAIDEAGAEATEIARSDVLVEQDFRNPFFPVLSSLGSLRRGPADRPSHAVIEGENFHAIGVLLATYEGQVDVLYLDPPYNTGNRDWAYNNDYVDPADQFASSKWLAFMERRLRLARRLLKPDGVMIVTVDEHEVHHLGMLVAQLFPDMLSQMVTIVINPKGTGKLNFARVEEYAFYLIPRTGESIIRGLPKNEVIEPAAVLEAIDAGEEGEQTDTPEEADDLEPMNQDDGAADGEYDEAADEGQEQTAEGEVSVGLPFPAAERDDWELRHARRRGGESSYRQQRPNQFYPIWIDTAARKVVSVGETLPLEESPSLEVIDGLTPIWPIDREGNQRCWRFKPDSMRALVEAGRVALGRYNEQTGTWTINYWVRRTSEKKPKTVWHETKYDAGTHGTTLLNNFLGRRAAFPFPKSVYAVQDALAMVVRERPDALIVDFFAGSGTTLHSTLLLNEIYPGRRRCVLVTNNELNHTVAKRLQRQGHYRGDPDFEAAGVFESVTRPRVKAAITGKRPNDTDVPGRYIGGRPFAQGFNENVEFFRLDYLDPASIELGLNFNELHPMLWLRAGGVGERAEPDLSQPFFVAPNSPYAVLFDPSGMVGLLAALDERPDIKTVYVVADSAATFSDLATSMPESVNAVQLYRSYLETLRGATQ